MNALRRHPWFTAWFALCLMLGGGGAWWWQRLHTAARVETKAVHQKRAERTHLQTAIGAGELVEEVVAEKNDGSEPAQTEFVVPALPKTSLEAFLALAEARTAMRRSALEQGMTVAKEEMFGFGAYAQEGPGVTEISATFAQLAIVRQAVEKLGACGPVKLRAVRREGPATGTAGKGDTFVLEKRLDLRVPALLEGSAVRLEFAGDTGALRKFLREVAGSADDLVVRNIAVGPLPENGKAGAATVGFTVDLLQVVPVWPGGRNGLPVPAPEMLAWGKETRADSYGLFSPPGAKHREKGVNPSAASPRFAAETLELLAVEREPYRVQLAGCYETREGWVALLEDPALGEVRRVRVGERLDEPGLVLRDLAWRLVEVVADDGSRNRVRAAVATFRDERSAAEVVLTSIEPKFTGAWRAVLRTGPHEIRRLRVDDGVQVGPQHWRVARITNEPAAVEFILTDETGTEVARRQLRVGPVEISAPIPLQPISP